MDEKRDPENSGRHAEPSEFETACDEYREMSRRAFLNKSTSAAAGLVAVPAWLPGIALAGNTPCTGKQPDILVTCFWRGGPDMLAYTPPYEDPWLYMAPYNSGSEVFPNGLRPNIGLLPPDPKDKDPQALRCAELGAAGVDAFGINKAFLDTEFGGSGGYNTIHELFLANEVAVIVAAGSPDTNRSHFSAEAFIEFGTPNQPRDEVTGWLARYLSVVCDTQSPLRGAAFSANRLIPKMLTFADKTLAFQALDEVVLPGNALTSKARAAILQARYSAQTEEPLKGSVLNAFEIIALLENVQVKPDPLAKYTTSDFGRRLMNAAALIRGGVDVQVVYADRTGWDNHAQLQPFKDGNYYDRLKDISQNLAAFRIDLRDYWDRITLVCQGEFGRQINENADLGTDHGNGGVMMVMGGNVNGGVYSKKTLGGVDGWPGLDPALTIDADAVRTTIDYRAIYREILQKRMGLSQSVIDGQIFNTLEEQPQPVLGELGVVNAGA